MADKPKSPGRGKKVPPALHEGSPSMGSVELEAPVKKSPGRGKKAGVAGAPGKKSIGRGKKQAENSDPDAGSPPPAKKGRGRAKRNSDDTDGMAEPPVKKPVGRGKKQAAEAPESPPVKKPGGRGKKEKEEVDTSPPPKKPVGRGKKAAAEPEPTSPAKKPVGRGKKPVESDTDLAKKPATGRGKKPPAKGAPVESGSLENVPARGRAAARGRQSPAGGRGGGGARGRGPGRGRAQGRGKQPAKGRAHQAWTKNANVAQQEAEEDDLSLDFLLDLDDEEFLPTGEDYQNKDTSDQYAVHSSSAEQYENVPEPLERIQSEVAMQGADSLQHVPSTGEANAAESDVSLQGVSLTAENSGTEIETTESVKQPKEKKKKAMKDLSEASVINLFKKKKGKDKITELLFKRREKRQKDWRGVDHRDRYTPTFRDSPAIDRDRDHERERERRREYNNYQQGSNPPPYTIYKPDHLTDQVAAVHSIPTENSIPKPKSSKEVTKKQSNERRRDDDQTLVVPGTVPSNVTSDIQDTGQSFKTIEQPDTPINQGAKSFQPSKYNKQSQFVFQRDSGRMRDGYENELLQGAPPWQTMFRSPTASTRPSAFALPNNMDANTILQQIEQLQQGQPLQLPQLKPTATEYDSMQKVKVRIVISRITEIDTMDQSFDAEVYIQARWVESHLAGLTEAELDNIPFDRCWSPKFTILNLVGGMEKDRLSLMVRYEANEVHPVVTYMWFVKATFSESMELEHFPFDTQELSVILSSDRSMDEIDIVQDSDFMSSLSDGAVKDSQEWKPFRHIDFTKDFRSSDFFSTSMHPVLVASCHVRRRLGFYFWNFFIVIFIIIGLTLTILSIDPSGGDRLGVTMTLFLTCVAFKLVVKASLPHVSYLTYLDVYLVFTLMYLGTQAAENAIIAHLARFRRREKVIFYDEVAQSILLALLALFHAAFLIYIQLTAFKRRRKMDDKDYDFHLEMKKRRKSTLKQVNPLASQITKDEEVVPILAQDTLLTSSNPPSLLQKPPSPPGSKTTSVRFGPDLNSPPSKATLLPVIDQRDKMFSMFQQGSPSFTTVPTNIPTTMNGPVGETTEVDPNVVRVVLSPTETNLQEQSIVRGSKEVAPVNVVRRSLDPQTQGDIPITTAAAPEFNANGPIEMAPKRVYSKLPGKINSGVNLAARVGTVTNTPLVEAPAIEPRKAPSQMPSSLTNLS